ncbi:hypothetical protein [Streptomyces xantholiticus]|uniref:hypothetical protein n=1 Tax=Streptomyces xantholiticus TaxID=68285 RepID=UPI003D9E128B
MPNFTGLGRTGGRRTLPAGLASGTSDAPRPVASARYDLVRRFAASADPSSRRS